MRKFSISLGLLLFLIACEQQQPVAPPEPGLDLTDQAAGSHCSTVKFTAVLTPTGDVTYSGTLSGDLEGTVDLVFDEFHPMTGVTRVVAADATFHISGGTLPELIGQSFVTRLENRNVFLPGTNLVKNLGSLRAISGVETANLTYTGQTVLGTEIPTLDFNGVICPE